MTDDLSLRVAALEAQLAELRQRGVPGAEPFHHVGSLESAIAAADLALAPLRGLFEDDTVNDILINGTSGVFVERGGILEKTSIQFASDDEVRHIAQAIAAETERTLDPRKPLLDARLADGSRVNIIAPPLSIDGTTISIRKFRRSSITLDRMAEQGNLSAGLAEFLKVVSRCKLNVIISGGTGSGKTTMLNALSQHIDPRERIVTIEDAAELRLQQPHVVRLETRPVTRGYEHDEVNVRELMKNALRMRPDRIIIGEVRGAEAFDMMQAINSGHEGSLTTVHANHPRDALARIENMVTMTRLHLPSQAIRAQMASAIQLIIQVSRMRDGQRRVAFVSEVVGMESEIITMQDLFTFQAKGEDADGKLTGEFRWTGIMPRFLRRVAYYGESERLSNALGVKLPKF